MFYGREFIPEARLTQRNMSQSMDQAVESRNLMSPKAERRPFDSNIGQNIFSIDLKLIKTISYEDS